MTSRPKRLLAAAIALIALALIPNAAMATDPKPLVVNYGEVQISVEQRQPVLTTPGGQAIQLEMGVPMFLPNDADNSGADTYMVAEVRRVDGVTWLGLYLGSLDWGYVRLDTVTPTTFLPSSTPRRIRPSTTPRPRVPNIGIVQIRTENPTSMYQTPGGAEIHDGAANYLQLPVDVDGSGADTYVVTSVRTVRGEKWLGIFVGTLRWAWVPLNAVEQITEIEGV